MAGALTELNEVVSTDESQTKESILCPITFFYFFLHVSAAPTFL